MLGGYSSGSTDHKGHEHLLDALLGDAVSIGCSGHGLASVVEAAPEAGGRAGPLGRQVFQAFLHVRRPVEVVRRGDVER